MPLPGHDHGVSDLSTSERYPVAPPAALCPLIRLSGSAVSRFDRRVRACFDADGAHRRRLAPCAHRWRTAFGAPDAFFGFVQLSTFGCTPVKGWNLPLAVPQLRDAQMAAAKLHNVGWVTNADLGAGCNVHPPRKATVGARLGNAALGLIYNTTGGPIAPWRSPSYKRMVAVTAIAVSAAKHASPVSPKDGASRAATASTMPTAAAAVPVSRVVVTVELNDPAPLTAVYPPNYAGLDLNGSTPAGYPAGVSGNCTALNRGMPGVCAWAAIQLAPVPAAVAAHTATTVAAAFWVNATASRDPDPTTTLWC